jgi:hypothetical protein
VGLRGTVRQDEHRVWGACVALARDCRASTAAGSCPSGDPTGTDIGQETEVDAGAQPSVAWTAPPEGAEASFQVGRDRATLVVGLALCFALSASPCGLRRATLRAKPQMVEIRDAMGHARSRSSLLAHPDAKIFDENQIRRKKGYNQKRGHFNRGKEGDILKEL